MEKDGKIVSVAILLAAERREDPPSLINSATGGPGDFPSPSPPAPPGDPGRHAQCRSGAWRGRRGLGAACKGRGIRCGVNILTGESFEGPGRGSAPPAEARPAEDQQESLRISA